MRQAQKLMTFMQRLCEFSRIIESHYAVTISCRYGFNNQLSSVEYGVAKTAYKCLEIAGDAGIRKIDDSLTLQWGPFPGAR